MITALRRLTYHEWPTSLARAVGLNELLRSTYFRLAAPKQRMRVRVSGASADFFVRSPSELRMLERAVDVRDSGVSELDLIELLAKTVRLGDTVYDIGANAGLYSVFLSQRVGPQGRVISFEPDGRNYERLRENVELNRLANVACFRKALGDQNHTRALYIHRDSPSESTLLASREPGYTRTEIVEVVNGDAFRDTLGLPIPQVIKIDVEGYEYSVLRGFRQTLTCPTCRFVCIEVHPQALPAGLTVECIRELVRSCGFNQIESYTRGREQHLACYKPSPVERS